MCAKQSERMTCSPVNEADSYQQQLFHILMNEIHYDAEESRSSMQEMVTVVNYISNFVMNGVPLIDLKDFLSLSANVNKEIGLDSKKKLLSQTMYRQRFGNFLDCENLEIRISPKSCYAEKLHDFLSKRAPVRHCKTVEDSVS